mmetsp:Transcript_93621/g.217654  ORF Transcript_93621/g.217654 Transcript_93621/m.217654 type:complete len:235 (-) Transcript_93621:45-749(-)
MRLNPGLCTRLLCDTARLEVTGSRRWRWWRCRSSSARVFFAAPWCFLHFSPRHGLMLLARAASLPEALSFVVPAAITESSTTAVALARVPQREDVVTAIASTTARHVHRRVMRGCRHLFQQRGLAIEWPRWQHVHPAARLSRRTTATPFRGCRRTACSEIPQRSSAGHRQTRVAEEECNASKGGPQRQSQAECGLRPSGARQRSCKGTPGAAQNGTVLTVVGQKSCPLFHSVHC